MKTYNISGEARSFDSLASLHTAWDREYYILLRKYEELKKKYDELALEKSWRDNPDGMGR